MGAGQSVPEGGGQAVSLRDKERCVRCGHPRHRHTGNHVKGFRAICRQEIGRGLTCPCLDFRTKEN